MVDLFDFELDFVALSVAALIGVVVFLAMFQGFLVVVDTGGMPLYMKWSMVLGSVVVSYFATSIVLNQ